MQKLKCDRSVDENVFRPKRRREEIDLGDSHRSSSQIKRSFSIRSEPGTQYGERRNFDSRAWFLEFGTRSLRESRTTTTANSKAVCLPIDPNDLLEYVEGTKNDAFQPNRRTDSIMKTRDVRFQKNVTIHPLDTKQYKLINITCVCHLVSIFATLIMIQFGWDQNLLDWVTTPLVDVCKAVVSICTIIAFYCTATVRKEQWLEHKELDGAPLKQRTTTLLLALEYLVIILHVPPFTSKILPESWGWTDQCNMIVFFRAYIIFELLRVRSPLWRLRRVNFNKRGEPSPITGIYFLKYSMTSSPLKFFFCTSCVLLLFLSAAMESFERWEQPEMGIRTAMYHMVIVFTSVGLGDVTCLTWLGRLLTMTCAANGIVFLSILMNQLFEAIEMQYDEMEIKENHLTIMALIEYRNFAAIIIQKWWKKTRKRHTIHGMSQHTSYFKSVPVAEEICSTSLSDAKEAIQEHMTIAKKQSIAGVTRATQALVERFKNDVKKDMHILIKKVSQLQILCHGNAEALKMLGRQRSRNLKKSHFVQRERERVKARLQNASIGQGSSRRLRRKTISPLTNIVLENFSPVLEMSE